MCFKGALAGLVLHIYSSSQIQFILLNVKFVTPSGTFVKIQTNENQVIIKVSQKIWDTVPLGQ